MQFTTPLRVMITGASGFIGQHLSVFLEKQGFDVWRVVRKSSGAAQEIICNLSSPAEVENLFQGYEKIDFLIHLAAHAIPSRNFDDLHIQQQDTILPALNIARFMPESVKLALFIGSCEEYGSQPITPFKEEYTPHPISPYGWGKVSALFGVELIANARKLKWTWIRPFLTYGPSDRNSRTLIPFIIDQCRKNAKILLTLGEQTRDFLFIEDFNRMIVKIINEPSKSYTQILNLCTGQPRAINDVATQIQALMKNGELCFGAIPYRSSEQMSFFGSREKFEKLYGQFEFTPFEEALKKTIKN